MNTKQGKMITKIISTVLVVVLLVVVVACNMGNKSSENNETSTQNAVEEKIIFAEAVAFTDKGITFESQTEVETEEMIEETTEENSVGSVVVTDTDVVAEDASQASLQFIANVSDTLNVRANSTIISDIVGTLQPGDGGIVLSKGPQWSRIQSGNVTGYVMNEYIYMGEEAEAHLADFCSCKAVALVNSLRMRNAADESAKVVATMDAGYEVPVISKDDNWTAINYDGQTLYTATEYLSFEYEIGTGKTVEEAQAEIEAELERQRLEAEAAAEAERQRQLAYQQAIENSHIVQTVQQPAITISEEEAYILACTVSAEAGGDIYEDQLAVANVILNRLKSGRWGNTVQDVVYARGQFAVVTDGALQRYISRGPLDSAVRATQDALSGINNVPDYNYFCARYAANFSRYTEYSIIGAQVFYRY